MTSTAGKVFASSWMLKKFGPARKSRHGFFKLKTKQEQDAQLLLDQIREAGLELYGIETVRVQPQFLGKRRRGGIGCCKLCGEPYPVDDGAICRACAGEAPYLVPGAERVELIFDGPALDAVDLQDAVGKTALHDMTMIVPGKSKGAAFVRGQQFTAGDLCRLQQMGRRRIFVEEQNPSDDEWVHENEAALSFAGAMAGEGVRFVEPPKEGKINFVADRDGLFVVNVECLEEFNMIPGVMCASRRGFTRVSSGRNLAGTRAIPLYLPKASFLRAITVLRYGPLFRVLPMRKARVAFWSPEAKSSRDWSKTALSPSSEPRSRRSTAVWSRR